MTNTQKFIEAVEERLAKATKEGRWVTLIAHVPTDLAKAIAALKLITEALRDVESCMFDAGFSIRFSPCTKALEEIEKILGGEMSRFWNDPNMDQKFPHMNIGFFDIPPGIEKELLRLYDLVHTNPEMIPWIEAKIDRIHDLFLTGQIFVPAQEVDK